ncbi:hypothetical protein L2729_09410 [Shewanella gelidimarina]|uniref:hypothetical protein n=1 Tax=Shewanella gelidimarina TaxID=56813 RepID=UPI00200C2038|nr:hypothetical protein [Shewanella gelidimarina]MCL1058219.1 hypothetical protein [Shewanella gelidimarina]
MTRTKQLTHANDLFPRSIRSNFQGPTLLFDYQQRDSQQQLIADQLSATYPLSREIMANLADMSFRGETCQL